jgi:hypothetical protein
MTTTKINIVSYTATLTAMSAPLVLNGVTFDVSKVSYTKPKVNNAGGKSVNVLGENNKSLCLSTPLMLTWGVNEYEGDGNAPSKYDMSLQFPRDQDSNNTEDVQQFLENLRELEEKIKTDARVHAKEWFGKSTMSAEVTDALFTPMLKYPKDQNTGEPDLTRQPRIVIKLPFWDGNFRTEIYDMDRRPLYPDLEKPSLTPVDFIQKGQNVALVIQSGGIWFANGKFGSTWRLVQAVVQPKASILGSRTCHVIVPDSARQVLAADRAREVEESSLLEQEDSSAVATSATAVESSDEEEAAVEPEPTPPPAAKKKKVVRKKKAAE